ncbi:MAG: bile acid:sodium symporter family protein [Firmicutes bacterium]|nr:bile acid:sodium symporter family protein [Bacillota bacterium]
MIAAMARWNEWLEARFTWLILASLALGLLNPGLARVVAVAPYFIAVIMFLVALRCRMADVVRALRSPGKIGLLLSLVYLVMPFFAWTIARGFLSHEPRLAAGLVLINSLPVAATCSMWAGIAGGDLALGLTAVSLTTLLSGLATPAVLALFIGTMIDFDPGPLMRGLFWTVMIPVALGLMVGERRRAFVDRHGPQIGLLIKPFMLSMLVINAALLVPYLAGLPPLELVRLYLVVFLQMMGGYLLGFAITTLLGLDYAASITMTYAATMRNNGAGILIAVSYFSPLMALPITLNTLIQQPIASTIYKFYRPWRARRDGRLRSLGGA